MMGFLVEQCPGRAILVRLIQAAQASPTNDTRAMNEIVRRFDPLALRLARSTATSEHLHDDLANAARIAVVQAVRRHDPANPGFPAFAKVYMRGAVLREYQRWLPPAPPAEEPTIMPREPSEPSEPSEEFEVAVLDQLAPWGDGPVEAKIFELRPAQRLIADLRYVDDAPLEQIAEVTGTSSSAVSQRLATIHRAVAEVLAA